MRKMSGGREKLQLHRMNRVEFSWGWKRIIKGVQAHFHSPSVSFGDPQEAPNRVTGKVKCCVLPDAYAWCWGLFLLHPLGALPFP